jgi:hypothetical protein
MANTYTYDGPGTRWAEGNPTAEDLMNLARINADHLHEALNTIMDTDVATANLKALTLDGNVTVVDDIWIGLGAAAGRIVFDSTPTPDAISILSANLGIGTASPEGLVHIFDGSAGAIDASGSAFNSLIIENSAHVGITFLSPNTSNVGFYFGDEDDYDVGQFFYDHSADRFDWVVNAAGTAMSLTTTGLGINETAPEGTIALNIHNGANDDESFVLKNSDVAHGMTGYTEADTYFSITKDNAVTGGATLWSYSEGNAGLILHPRLGAIATDDTSTSLAAVMIKGEQWDGGTSVINAPASSNVLAVTDGSNTRFVVKGNGILHATYVTAGSGDLDGTALDAEDDIGLIRLFERTIHNDLGIIISKWDEQLNVHEDDLRRVGVFKGDFYCLQRMDSLLGGGVWKNHCDIQGLKEDVHARHAELKKELEQTRSELVEAQAELRKLAA